VGRQKNIRWMLWRKTVFEQVVLIAGVVEEIVAMKVVDTEERNVGKGQLVQDNLRIQGEIVMRVNQNKPQNRQTKTYSTQNNLAIELVKVINACTYDTHQTSLITRNHIHKTLIPIQNWMQYKRYST
jgi:hypothetical protein